MFSKYCCFYYHSYIYYFSLSEIEEAFHYRNESVVFNVLKNLWDLSGLSFDESYKSSAIAQKMKFSIKDFVSTSDQIHRYLRIRLHLPKKSWMETFIFWAVCTPAKIVYLSWKYQCGPVWDSKMNIYVINIYIRHKYIEMHGCRDRKVPD